MPTPVSITKVNYAGLGLTIGDTININYALAFDIPEFATLTVVEEGVGTPLAYTQISVGILQITQDGTTPASGTFVLSLDVPTDSFVRDLDNGNLFRAETLEDLFTQAMIISGSVAEGRLGSFGQDLDFNLNKGINLGDGTNPSDAINKGQLDAAVSGIIAGMLPDGDYGTIRVSGAGTNWALIDGTYGSVIVSSSGTALNLGNDTVNTAQIVDDSVGADQLDDTGVAAGSYTLANITVDAQGRISSASSGSVPSVVNATETDKGVVELATDAQVQAGTEIGETGAPLVLTPKQFKDFGGVVTLRSTRTTTGTWSITGLTVGKPLIVSISGATPQFAYRVTSGSNDGTVSGAYDFVLKTAWGNQNSGNSTTIIPTATTVEIEVNVINAGTTAYAYQ